MSWEEIIRIVSKYLEAGQLKSLLLILLIAVPVYILFNVSRVVDSFDSFRKRNQAIIKDYFDKEVPKDAVTEKVILDARETRYFKSIVGIYAEEKFRHALIKFHDDLSPDVSWRSIRKAMRYLRLRDREIKVEFTLSALIAYSLYVPLYLLVSYILLILIQQFFLQPVEFIGQPNKIFYSVAYGLIFWVLLREIWTIHSAVRIWEKLNRGKTKIRLVKQVIKARFTSDKNL
jgi:hypothetical protein